MVLENVILDDEGMDTPAEAPAEGGDAPAEAPAEGGDEASSDEAAA